jgi:transposase
MDRDKFVFQQDNARVHTAGLVNTFIKKSKIRLLKWPANSPDINPIENLWASMKRELNFYPTAPKSLRRTLGASSRCMDKDRQRVP